MCTKHDEKWGGSGNVYGVSDVRWVGWGGVTRLHYQACPMT